MEFKQIIKELIRNRFVLIITYTVVILISNWFFTEQILPNHDTENIWFYSGILMVLFSILFIEPYYSSPQNVITSVLPLLLVFLSIENSFDSTLTWGISIAYLLFLLIASIFLVSKVNRKISPDHNSNKFAEYLKNIIVTLGQGKLLYSIVFIYFLIITSTAERPRTITLLIIWATIFLIDPKKIKNTFCISKKKSEKIALGKIFSVQSNKMFLVKLYEDKTKVNKFDLIEFQYSMRDRANVLVQGVVFDTNLLNQEKHAKVLQLRTTERQDPIYENDIVYRITEQGAVTDLEKELKVDNFVGVVIKRSEIGKIKFEYSKKNDDLQEGDLIELKINNIRLFYQVINGFTENENLNGRNETGFIEGEAIQLGEWVENEMLFKKYGWVPSINTPLFKADTSNEIEQIIEYPEFQLGLIPNTTLPSVINLAEALNHHMALIGVTGSGKSYIAKEIIKQIAVDTRVICIDITGEWTRDLKINDNNKEFNEVSAQADTDAEIKTKIEPLIIGKIIDDIEVFLDSKDNIGVAEISTMSNTEESLEQTGKLLDRIFNYAKEKYKNGEPIQIALVLEEAHTIVPEGSFSGVSGDFGKSKAIVNKICQIALQGRKYGIGLLVIAQRTANVSKTILTQCNTVICFQAFDETSFNFLESYVGKDLVKAIPNLKQYHAIAAGKALRSKIPMVIDLTNEGKKTCHDNAPIK